MRRLSNAGSIKDRTFIFGTYEGIRQSKGITQVSTVLSDAARTGSLSAASGGPVTVDPNVARYLALMPHVNAGLNSGGDTGNFSFAGLTIINETTAPCGLTIRFRTPTVLPATSFSPAPLVCHELEPEHSAPDRFRASGDGRLVGSHSLHLPFTGDDDNMVLPALTSAGFLWPKTPGTKVDPNAGSLRPLLFDGGATYQGLQTQLKKAMSHGMQLGASYTWSKCLDTGSTGTVGDVFLNSIRALPFFSSAIRRGRCDFDIKENFIANYVWDLPSPKFDSALASSLADGWELGGVVSASTGMPFTVVLGGDPLGLGNLDPIDFAVRLTGSGCSSLVNSGSVNSLKTQCFGLPQATSSIAAQCAPFIGDRKQSAVPRDLLQSHGQCWTQCADRAGALQHRLFGP